KSITLSKVVQHYPTKSDMISDRPGSDSGGNFGRLARTGLLDDYIAELFNERLVGISLSAWQRFLSIFTESNSMDEVNRAIEKLADLMFDASSQTAEKKIDIPERLLEILALVDKK